MIRQPAAQKSPEKLIYDPHPRGGRIDHSSGVPTLITDFIRPIENNMPNMSYCRFQNTYSDLQECQDALNEGALNSDDLSDEELRAARKLIRVCEDIASDFGNWED